MKILIRLIIIRLGNNWIDLVATLAKLLILLEGIMGYTHYWGFKKPKRGETRKVEGLYQRAIKDCTKVIKYYRDQAKGSDASLSGFSAHAPIGRYGGLQVNGKGEYQCEEFTLREHYKQNFDDSIYSGGGFCKTRGYYYDKVVVACLIILKHHLGDYIDVGSDGQAVDWLDGHALAQSVLKRNFKIPIAGQAIRSA